MRSKTTRGEGLVPRRGGGGAWQNLRCQFAVPSHNSSFSYLGVSAPAGMSNCYENNPSADFFNWGSVPAPHFVIRGIPLSLQPPIHHSGPPFVIPAKAGIQEVKRWANATPTIAPTSAAQIHALACRHDPA